MRREWDGFKTDEQRRHALGPLKFLKSTRSEHIANRKWTEAERQTLRRIAVRQALDDSRINLEDIPRLTDEQLAKYVRLRDARPRKRR